MSTKGRVTDALAAVGDMKKALDEIVWALIQIRNRLDELAGGDAAVSGALEHLSEAVVQMGSGSDDLRKKIEAIAEEAR